MLNQWSYVGYFSLNKLKKICVYVCLCMHPVHHLASGPML